ncbi:hypothetical protein ACFXDH_40650 [Streptomyces sp. NPDC059467]|uniref:hypothetical protein n=1 Tax=Streptomyces sp. NPDC059467 TaxID=3346844 RepID=UPI0036957DC9
MAASTTIATATATVTAAATVTARKFALDVMVWTSFVCGLGASLGAGAFLDGTGKNIVTYGGSALALLAGSRISRKPRIKAFLSTAPVLWFLFLFNGGVATYCALALHGIDGTVAATAMGLVSLGAAGGLVNRRRLAQN